MKLEVHSEPCLHKKEQKTFQNGLKTQHSNYQCVLLSLLSDTKWKLHNPHILALMKNIEIMEHTP